MTRVEMALLAVLAAEVGAIVLVICKDWTLIMRGWS